MKCNNCGKSHEKGKCASNIKYEVKKSLQEKGFPTDSKRYASAHERANKAEKRAYPAGYEQMKKMDKKFDAKLDKCGIKH